MDAENLRSPCSEEIRELVNPHFSFTRGRVKTPTGDFLYSSSQNVATLQVHPARSWVPDGRGTHQPSSHS